MAISNIKISVETVNLPDRRRCGKMLAVSKINKELMPQGTPTGWQKNVGNTHRKNMGKDLGSS